MTGALLGDWSRLLSSSLRQAGLRHAVICPGSRSTPFAWALASEPGIECHGLIDERVAAFFALGLARASGEPALVLSTSGSAAASFFPAIVEASLARLPLVVLTADRPLEAQGVGAAQTIDQDKIYGGYVRAYFDLGTPDPSPSALAGLARSAAQALLASRSPEPGPVHLNARARKPLEPSPPESDAERETRARVDALIAGGVTRAWPPTREPEAAGVAELAERLRSAERAVIVAGPVPVWDATLAASVAALGERASLPVYAEATSQLRFAGTQPAGAVDALDWLLGSEAGRTALKPDLVIRFGATPTSSVLERLLGGDGAPELAVVTEHGWSDPSSRARVLVQGPLARVAGALVEALGGRAPSAAQRRYAELLRAANAAARAAIDDAVEGSTGGAEPSEPAVVRAAVESMPAGSLLVVGNSLPVRELDAFVPASARSLRVASQRGANGIDGIVSGAAGTACASSVPTLVLVGDVSFAHDLGGLAAARQVTTPLAILVLDNDGGRIFDELPVAALYEATPSLRPLWLTPPTLSIPHAAGLFGLPPSEPHTLAELRSAVRLALERPSATLIHARVGPTSAREVRRAAARELELRLEPILARPGS